MAELDETKSIKYSTPEAFDTDYPKGSELNRGSYGVVYESGNFIIKEFLGSTSFIDMVKELTFYASYRHPCILTPVAWTLKGKTGYLALPRGKGIIDAYDEGDISFEEIVSDLLSAVTFLNSQGVAHCDYKPGNIIYHGGYAKLIDFGISRKAILGTKSRYFITDLAYTPPYIDPEYYLFQNNNIKCELYSLAMACAAIIDPDSTTFGYLSYTTYENPDLHWFFSRASALRENRPTAHELLESAPPTLIVRRHIGTRFEEPAVPESKNCDSEIMKWLVQVTYTNSYRAETAFLMLHLFRRVYFTLMETYPPQDAEIRKYLIATGIITLVGHLLNDVVITSAEWVTQPIFAEVKDVEDKHLQTMADIVKVTHGVLITLTYWDYAKSKEDLLPLLRDIVSCEYNPTKIRDVKEGVDKCVKMAEIMTAAELEEFTTTEMPAPFGENIPIRRPCLTSARGDVKEVERLWGLENAKLDIKYACVLLRNRFVLSTLELGLALKIYESLLNGGKPMDGFILDTICKVKWRVKGTAIIKDRIHPFRK